MTITGVNFGAVPGLVTLNGFDQTLTTWTPSQISAQVAGVGDPGTYQLDVRRTDAQGQVFRDQADVAFGTVGLQRPVGPEGPQGSPRISAYEVVELTGSAQNVVPGEYVAKSPSCPTGKKVFGGGCSSGLNLHRSAPVNNSWECG